MPDVVCPFVVIRLNTINLRNLHNANTISAEIRTVFKTLPQGSTTGRGFKMK